MYAKCFSTLECCGWAYGSTLNVLRQCRSGVDFQDFGVELSLSDDVMPWLRLKPPVECIPHPYDMYAKCLSTLTCCWWAYGSTLNVLRQCRSGVDFQDFGVDLSPSDDVVPWLRLKPPVECNPHPYGMYTKCLSTLICYEWAYGSTLTVYACAGRGWIFRILG
jgi:hypothetical protein